MNTDKEHDVSSSGITRLFGTDPRIVNPKPVEMHANAHLFHRDAEALGDRASAGQFVLLMHAVELALKSFLHQRGRSLSELSKKPFGHDLVELLKAARTSGLMVSDADAETIVSRLNEYTDRARIRYEFSFTMPLITDVQRVTRALLADTEPQLPLIP